MPTNANIPCDAWLRALNAAPNPAVGIVWDTFGTDRSCAEAFLKENASRPHAIRVHISNETWRDDGNKGYAGDLFLQETPETVNDALERAEPTHLATLRQRIAEVTDWLRAHITPKTTAILSTGLEDTYNDRAYRVVHDLIRERWAGVLERNPLRQGELDANETHGPGAQCGGRTFIASEDGGLNDEAASRLFLSRNEGCLVTFLWRPEHQGLRRTDDGGITGRETPPRERAFSFEDVEQMEGLLGAAK